MRLYESLRGWQSHQRWKRQVKPLRILSDGAVTTTGRKEDPLEVVRSCRDRSSSVESYRSDIILQEEGDPRSEHWEVESIRLDRFYVWQESWIDQKEVYDEWITLGEDLYIHPGLWGKIDSPDLLRLTKTFALEAFLGLLDSVGGQECSAFKLGTRPFLRLDTDGTPPILTNPDLGDREEGATILWIDDGSRLPAKIKASARFQVEGAPVRVQVEQVFFDFDADISISAPDIDFEPI